MFLDYDSLGWLNLEVSHPENRETIQRMIDTDALKHGIAWAND